MKNACIVLRDNRVLSDGADFLPVLTALTEGGYPQDKIFLLNERDSREFAQTFVECKNFLKTCLSLRRRILSAPFVRRRLNF